MSYFGLALEQLEFNLAENPWTAAREAFMREWYPKMKTADVAGLINRETGSRLNRNQVIGKAHRMGLVAFKPQAATVPKGTKQSVGARIRRRFKINAPRSTAMSLGTIGVECDHPFNDETTPLKMNPMGYNEDWPNDRCRWTCGDPKLPDFYFCGSDDGVDVIERRPFCKFHSRMAYSPSRPPLRAAMARRWG